MALIKTSPQIISIKGRFGGVYFKTGPDGMHIQAMPRVWNYTRTPAQQGAWGTGSGFSAFGIKGYSGAAGIWLMALLAFFAVAWAAFATANLFHKPGHEPKYITGFNWFIHYTLGFPEAERPPFWEPPHRPGEFPNFLVTYQGTWHYEHTPQEWPVDSPGGYYWTGLIHNGKLSYRTTNLNWYLWWKDPVWVLSEGLGFEGPGLTYYSDGPDIVDYYRNPVTGKFSHVYFGDPDEVDKPH